MRHPDFHGGYPRTVNPTQIRTETRTIQDDLGNLRWIDAMDEGKKEGSVEVDLRLGLFVAVSRIIDWLRELRLSFGHGRVLNVRHNLTKVKIFAENDKSQSVCFTTKIPGHSE